MGVSVQESSIIQRPIEYFFAFVSNMENSPLRGRTIKTSKVPKVVLEAPDGPAA